MQNEMRRQDQNFNTRLMKMRKDIEEVNSACWREKLCHRKKPDDCLSSHLEENAGGETTQGLATGPTTSAQGRKACHWPLIEKRSPHMTQERSIQNALPLQRLDQSPLQPAFPPHVTIATLTRKRSSDGSISVKNVPSLLSPSLSSHGGSRQGQRRGSLGSWLLKKLQIN
jgi:hypothetical protein